MNLDYSFISSNGNSKLKKLYSYFMDQKNAGPILESKGMCAIFQKTGKKCLRKGSKRAKYFKIWAKIHRI